MTVYEVLPEPRLILRLGALGNQSFGTKNGIAEDDDKIECAVRLACAKVFDLIDSVVVDIHQHDQKGALFHRWPDDGKVTSFTRTWLSRFFGRSDRWRRNQRAGTPSSVFSTEVPLVIIVAGDANGGDAFVREQSVLRSLKLHSRSVEEEQYPDYKFHPIVVASPCAIADGIGVGTIPSKTSPLPVTLDSAGQPIQQCLPRDEAMKRASIARSRAYGFRAQSAALRHHSDILIAVWDPDTEGKAGGTSESLAQALEERIPVIAIRVRAESRVDIDIVQSLEDLSMTGRPGDQRIEADNRWQDSLRKTICDILNFPDARLSLKPKVGGHDSQHQTDYDPHAAFASFRKGDVLKSIWTSRLWVLYDSFVQWRAGEFRCDDTNQRRYVRLRAWFHKLFVKHTSNRTKSSSDYQYYYGRIRDRAASGGMSGVYGNAHRGGILASYLLAATAVLMAVVGAILHFNHIEGLYVICVAALEFLVIMVMLALSACSHLEDWHEAYTDSRVLSEALRMMEFLSPLGLHTPIPRLPHFLRGDEQTPSPELLWAVWYFRALVRMAPLRLGPSNICLEKVRHHLTKHWIQKQIDYHSKNQKKQKQQLEDIEQFTGIVFILVFVCAFLHLIDLCFEWHSFFSPALLICVGGPALIAALHGYGSQIEIARLRQRSASMEILLREQQRVFESLDLTTDPHSAQAVWGLSTAALNTAAMMMDETADWSMLYKNADIHAG